MSKPKPPETETLHPSGVPLYYWRPSAEGPAEPEAEPVPEPEAEPKPAPAKETD